MDEPLEIPEAARVAAGAAYNAADDLYEAVAGAVIAAAPLIVAAAYRARARECNCMHDAKLLNCAADELDPQGLTK
jgi:hypothetical protein